MTFLFILNVFVLCSYSRCYFILLLHVWERHFETSRIETEEEIINEKQGIVHTAKLSKSCLKKAVIPTIFPPKYPLYQSSVEGESSRISPEEKKAKKVKKNLKEALSRSLETHAAYEQQRSFLPLAELASA